MPQEPQYARSPRSSCLRREDAAAAMQAHEPAAAGRRRAARRRGQQRGRWGGAAVERGGDGGGGDGGLGGSVSETVVLAPSIVRLLPRTPLTVTRRGAPPPCTCAATGASVGSTVAAALRGVEGAGWVE
ncbi:hypothetical protein CYMTET_35055 [Cymbomonas tetramitiformis]|uniref:Uncharacterized protein n=1 Tax=Cymbomonas tetramitiformis TaxID=36881 RepID=A0AAE0KP98_9CHLO|nr:hypothetical protein CYMTET_35055 [Cymbomonas tetramitiformis]